MTNPDADAPTHLAELVGADPDALAVTDGTTARTWHELDDRTHRVAVGLESLDLRPGGHVALIMTNRVEFIESMLGALRAGFTMTPVKTNWTVTEVSYILEDAQSVAVITDVDVGRQAAAAAGLPCVDVDAAVPYADWMLGPGGRIKSGRCGYRIPYTSGTTGRPKGVDRPGPVPTFEEWVQASAGFSTGIGLPATGTHLMASQLFHGAPLNFGLGAMFAGAALHVMPRWDASAALDHFAAGPTASIMVPTMFRQLLALPGEQRASLPTENVLGILHGGEACPVALKHEMIDWFGPVFTEYYGFTEGGFTTCTSDEWLARPGTVGCAAPWLEIRIVDDAGEQLGPNEVGTVYFRREGGRSFAYRNEPTKTDDAYLADDAFTVGDVGYLDDDGYLYLSGRTAEVIVAAGVNIYPAEIESVLFDVPGVADACVAGGPDPERGERPVAFIAVAPGHKESSVVAAAQAASELHLAGYKRPREVIVRAEIPRDPTGKVLRLNLRKQLWDTDPPSP